jgi:hypothetical protein
VGEFFWGRHVAPKIAERALGAQLRRKKEASFAKALAAKEVSVCAAAAFAASYGEARESRSSSNEGSPGISRFPIFYPDVRPDRHANRGRFFLGENVNTSVNGIRALAMRVLGQPHFL